MGMDIVTLKNFSEQGQEYSAVFAPGSGMNLMSLKCGEIEAIDQSTMGLFEQRKAGLGALIGPHFHRRTKDDKFSHGLARYAPWKYEASETQITAKLLGEYELNGVAIRELQEFDFEMHFDAKLVHDGLLIDYRVKSEEPSVIGFHYYYRLDGTSFVDAPVKNEYRDVETWKPIPDRWLNPENMRLHFPLHEDADWGFAPKQSPNEPFNRILLRTKSHLLHVDYCGNYDDETSWQLWHPTNASFACIEPLTALNPRKPKYTETHLQMKLSIY